MTRWSLFLQTLSLLHHFLGLYWPRRSHRPGPIDRCLLPRRALGRSTAELNAWGVPWPGPPLPPPRPRRELSRPGPRRELASPTDAAAGPTDRPGPGPGRGCDLPCQHRPADLVLHGVVDIYSPQRQKSTYRMLLEPLRPSLVRWDRRSSRPGRGCERRRAAGPPGRRSRACQVRIAPGPKRVRTRHGSRREQSPASATGQPRGG